jgi:hypothetical protein
LRQARLGEGRGGGHVGRHERYDGDTADPAELSNDERAVHGKISAES